MRGDVRRVDLIHRALNQNSRGEQVPTWTSPYATVYAAKRDVRGRERIAAQTRLAEIDTIFTIRFRADVLLTDQLVCEGKIYNILQVAEVGRRIDLELLATAVMP